MAENVEIRASGPDDTAAIELLYPQAFPEEELLPLVRDLLRHARLTLSLVATIDSQLAGHVIFTRCSVVGSSGKAALLGPLAVAPAWQRRGIGSELVRAGLRWLENEDVTQVFVLGDPAYYARLGFLQESGVMPPYPLPAEWQAAWQSRSLGGAATFRPGELSLPQPWRQPSLWAP